MKASRKAKQKGVSSKAPSLNPEAVKPNPIPEALQRKTGARVFSVDLAKLQPPALLEGGGTSELSLS